MASGIGRQEHGLQDLFNGKGSACTVQGFARQHNTSVLRDTFIHKFIHKHQQTYFTFGLDSVKTFNFIDKKRDHVNISRNISTEHSALQISRIGSFLATNFGSLP